MGAKEDRAREQRHWDAQELFFEVMEVDEKSPERAVELCREALKVYPDCVDAMMYLANRECRFRIELIERLRLAVEAGRRDIGPRGFKEFHGHFWGFIETRPFMRAMASLGYELADWDVSERVAEAVAIFEEMLDLNPSDNQGVRDLLGACYLRLKRYSDAAKLFRRYPDDWLGVPAWSRVLLVYATTGEQDAEQQLKHARARNPMAETYLTGRKRVPRVRAPYYSAGDESEAVLIADTLRAAWKAHPAAKAWLKAQSAEGAVDPKAAGSRVAGAIAEVKSKRRTRKVSSVEDATEAPARGRAND